MTKNRNKASEKLPIDPESIRRLNNNLDSYNSFYMSKSYKKDSSFVVDWQLPKKKLDKSVL